MSPYRGAVLIIGSLCWDPSPNRASWRDNRLVVNNAISVNAPIRYGKLSDTWGGTYTMVFSKLCYRKDYGLGTALAIPLRNQIEDVADLIREAADLWRVERKQEQNNSQEVSRRWGAVGLKVRPGAILPNEILQGWTIHYRNQTRRFQSAQTKRERPIIDENGFLKIEWLADTITATSLEFDFIMATAIAPTLDAKGRYPSARIISDAWQRDKEREGDNVRYFWNNQENGITTFQDDRIKQFLKKQEQ